MKIHALPALAAILAAGVAMAQTPADSKNPSRKTDESNHVQVTSNSAGNQHCRDTDIKTADGSLPAQTTMNNRLRKAEADCQKTAPKPSTPEPKSAQDPAAKSSVPSSH